MTFHEHNKQFSGKSIEQLASALGKGIIDTILDISLDNKLRTSFRVIDRNDDTETQRQLLGSACSVIGTTDGGTRSDKGDPTDYSTRLLSHWVRDKQIISLEDAIYRMTRQP